MAKPKFQRPTGTHDILPQNQGYYDKIYNTIKSVVGFYDFEKIDTPILEDFNLFIRSIGESTDIVEKEMFTLKTKGKDYFNLDLYHTIDKAKNSIIGFAKSEMKFKDYLWYLNENDNEHNKIVFDKALKDFALDNIVLSTNPVCKLLFKIWLILSI